MNKKNANIVQILNKKEWKDAKNVDIMKILINMNVMNVKKLKVRIHMNWSIFIHL